MNEMYDLALDGGKEYYNNNNEHLTYLYLN